MQKKWIVVRLFETLSKILGYPWVPHTVMVGSAVLFHSWWNLAVALEFCSCSGYFWLKHRDLTNATGT